MTKTFLNTSTGETEELQPAEDKALRFYERFKEAQEAEAAYEKAKTDVPDYTGQYSPVDYYGAAENAFHRAVDRLYEAVKDAAGEDAKDRQRAAEEAAYY